jgi:hypothetical protein
MIWLKKRTSSPPQGPGQEGKYDQNAHRLCDMSSIYKSKLIIQYEGFIHNIYIYYDFIYM